MDNQPPTLAQALAGAQAWWREAGVDSGFADEPQDWLARPEPKAGPAAAPKGPEPAAPALPPVPRIGGASDAWPDSWEAFAPWWTALPDLPGAGPALPPRGAAGAELMILVPMPEAEDRDTLLSARQGMLVANMLRAMGIAQDRALIASALPRHAGHPDWPGLAERGLDRVLAHLATIAAPRRLLLLGRDMLPLFGHDPAQAAAHVQQLALEGVAAPGLVARGPEALLEQPRFRRALWQGWLEWTEGTQ